MLPLILLCLFSLSNAYEDPFSGVDVTYSENKINLKASHTSLSTMINRVCWAIKRPCHIQNINNITSAQLENTSWEDWVTWLETEHDVQYDPTKHLFFKEKNQTLKFHHFFQPQFQPSTKLTALLQKQHFDYRYKVIWDQDNLIAIKSNSEDIEDLLLFLEKADCAPKQIIINMDIVSINADQVKELGIDPSSPLYFEKKSSLYQNIMTKIKNLESIGQAQYLSKPQLSVIEGGQASLLTEEHASSNGALSPRTFKIDLSSENFGPQSAVIKLRLKHLYNHSPHININNEISTEVYIRNQEMILLGGLKEDRVDQTQRCLIGIHQIPLLNKVFCLNHQYEHQQILLLLLHPTIKQVCHHTPIAK